MAEEKETEESKEESPKEKKSPLVLIIIIVVLILVILIGAVVAILFMGGDDEVQQQQQPMTQQAQSGGTQNNYQTNSATSKGLPSGTTFDKIGIMFPLDTFTVNLLSESGRRYLKVEMNLELDGEELGVELDTKKAVIRDIIIRILSSKSLEEISTMKGKDKLKEQIVDQLNARLVDGHINNAYFTDFVIQ